MRMHPLVFTALAAACGAASDANAGIDDLKGTKPGELMNGGQFVDADSCQQCHGGSGFMGDTTYLPVDTWPGTMMANAVRDPVYFAALSIANQDAPGIGTYCLRCHSPVGYVRGHATPPDGTAFDAIDNQGVGCDSCHRMVQAPPPDDPYYLANAQIMYDDNLAKRGPYDDAMSSSHETLHDPGPGDSRFCGQCHQVTHPDRLLKDKTGADTLLEFPIDTTYEEWASSAYAVAGGPDHASCIDCHMQKKIGDWPVATNFGAPLRTDPRDHASVGGNHWGIQAVMNAYPDRVMLFPDAFQLALDRTLENLRKAAAVTIVASPPAASPGASFDVTVRVENLTGHKLPTGYAESRRAWVAIMLVDAQNAEHALLGGYDRMTGQIHASPPTHIYRAQHGRWNGTAGVPDDHVALQDMLLSDTRIPPKGFVPSAVTMPTSEIDFTDGMGGYRNYDEATFTVTAPPSISGIVTLSARVYYQSMTREHIEFLKNENVTDMTGDTLETIYLATGEAPPILMASAEAPLDFSGTGGAGGAGGAGGTGGAAGASAGGAGGAPAPAEEGSCNCRTPGAPPTSSQLAWAALAIAAGASLHRRRRTRPLRCNVLAKSFSHSRIGAHKETPMRNHIALSLAAVAASLVTGCGTASPEPVAPGPTTATGTSMSTTVVTKPAGPPAVETTLANVGLDASAMDRSADPCTDFFQYACGGWLAKTEIPADEARWVRSFSEIDKRNEAELKRILEEAGKAKSPDALTKKIGDYYGACMDVPSVEAAGTKPIADFLAKAKKVKDAKSIGAFITELHARRIFPIFDIAGEQDFGDATKVIAQLDQAGLGLPDRDYYTKEDDKSKAIRAEYGAHVERMMKLAGYSEKDAKQAAADVMHLETELAKVSKTRVERRDPKGLYNKINRDGIAKTTPAFPWDDYFKGLGIAEAKDVNVTSVPFFEGVQKLLGSIKAPVWQNYLAWTVVRSTAGLLSKAFVDEAFKLQAMLTGQKEIRPRWKRCVDATDAALGELLAQPFVQANFAGESKKAAEEMVQQISAAFSRELEKLDWMDTKTKARAQEKRKMMAYLIGYPSKWRSYDFPIDPKAYAQNALASRAFEQKRTLNKIGKPLDREEWPITPPTVNAGYDPQKNHMVFPAGILQPPFYSVKAAVPVNLGAIGMVVGHELTHGFDDQGSQFAGNGNLENWWEPQVEAQFKAKTGCVEEQFSRYEPLPGLKLNGKLTLGENIGDLAGIKLAFKAYREMRKNAAETLVADGFTEDQQFFLSVAQSWCARSRDELTRLRVQIDPHSPPRFRVIGPASNLSEFAEAFSCKPGSPMRPTKTCAVW